MRAGFLVHSETSLRGLRGGAQQRHSWTQKAARGSEHVSTARRIHVISEPARHGREQQGG